ncbi:MAG: alpha/beta hydrolase [Ruminococcus sp.]|uniref:alpha/beta hydrolase n=1 Tax=Ruminococcus sp. TaxID=41978 RepID=UPI002873828A|nr:alpha/beta hydrolase [Ruminococcus sp.]MBQ3285461.1 alpha/beta hydrolase [Ruminococcus sp.]
MEKYFSVNEQGNSIKCKIYCDSPKAVKKAVIYGHGFSGHKDNKAAERFAEYVLKKHRDTAVVTYDAPCHGDDVKKKLSLSDCGAYLGLVTRYVEKQYHTDALYAYATSFGGYQFLKYISENGNPFRKIVLRSPAVHMYEVLSGRIMNPDERKALSRNKPVLVGFDRKIRVTQSFLDELKEADITARDFHAYADDILILHGTKDEIVPFDGVEAFARQNDIRFIAVENADHRFKDPKTMDIAVKATAEFLEL